MDHFFDALWERMQSQQSQLVVGLDPRLERMPEELVEDALRHYDGSEAIAMAIEEFNREVIDAVAPHAVAVKCQIAFYEMWGLRGLTAYSHTLEYAREADLPVIGDVKRNDIGSTAEAYASAHLGWPEEEELDDDEWFGPEELVADAITINPYFGSDGVHPFLERAEATGRGLFALVKTSNPSAREIQDLETQQGPVYERVGTLVEKWGEDYVGDSGYSLLGAVVGATYPQTLQVLREVMPHTFFLVPGVGAQGASAADAAAAFDRHGGGAVVNSSRGIIYAFNRDPYVEKYGESRWTEAVAAAARETRRKLWEATH